MKKFLFCTMFFAMMAMPFGAMADDDCYMRGDTDGNGRLDIDDVSLLINRILTGSWSTDLTVETFTINGVSFDMMPVEAGTFTMGATVEQGTDATDREKPAHQVTLTKDFHIGATEVTQALWQAVMGANPSYFTGDLNRPVEQMSWNDCQTFIAKLNQMTGKTFRMPTEAEWEFAARGGNLSQGYKYAGSDNVDEVAWYSGNSSNTTHPVGTKMANELGLYDMSGNVMEWCQDFYGDFTSEPQTDPTGPQQPFGPAPSSVNNRHNTRRLGTSHEMCLQSPLWLFS